MLIEDFKQYVIEAKERFKDNPSVIDVIEEMEIDLLRVNGSELTHEILMNTRR